MWHEMDISAWTMIYDSGVWTTDKWEILDGGFYASLDYVYNEGDTIEFEFDFEGDLGSSSIPMELNLYSAAGHTEAEINDSWWWLYLDSANTNIAEQTTPVTGAIGPGISEYDDAIAQGEFYLTLEVSWFAGTGPVYLTGARYNIVGEPDPTEDSAIVMQIQDDEIVHVPTAITVSVAGATPESVITFFSEGQELWSATTDSDGCLHLESIPVPDLRDGGDLPYFDAGTHTLIVVDGTTLGVDPQGSADYVIEKDPPKSDRVVGADADPIAVPEADRGDGFYSWVLQDLLPGGLGSYVMVRNPATMTSPHFPRELKATTSAHGDKFHIYEGSGAPVEWTLNGQTFTEAEYDALQSYFEINRRFYVIDHRNRAWKCTFVDINWELHLQTLFGDADSGEPTDWAQDYTITALVYDRDPKTPV